MTNPSPITDQELDRLADGELSPGEQRELLRALEASPDNWRRCALAFVEAQTLRRELSGLAAAPQQHVSVTKPLARPASRSHWLALAAAVLVAFTAGLLANRADPSAPPNEQPLAAAPQPPVAEQGPTREQLANAPVQRVDRPDPDAVTFWTRDEQGQKQSLRTRLVEADEMNQRLGVEFRSAVPPELRERLKQRGYRVDTRQRFAPLNIDDGRTLVVPVEDMRVEPVPLEYL